MAGDDGSPSASSTFLPLAKQLRRASVTSITSLFDKQSLNQTLDQIHNSASRSDTLTTFNDYTSPPPSSAVQKKPSDTGSGIGSWYTRMTSSVTSTKSASPGRDSRSRASTGHSDEAVLASSAHDGGQHDDRKKASRSLYNSDVLADSQSSLRAPSRRSQYSQAADTKSIASSTDGKKPLEAPKQISKTASHKAGPSVSSQLSASQISTVSSQEAKADVKPTPFSLKRAMTPDPSAPSSPMFQDLERSRASLSLLPGKNLSRTPSVSSSTSTRIPEPPTEGRRASAFPTLGAPDVSPTLSRFSSAPNVKVDFNVENKTHDAAKAQIDGAADAGTRSESPRKVSNNDAVEALKRLQAQGLGSASSTRAQTQTVGATLSQLRNRVLSRQYWMKDENARDCFYCGDPFSTFRRKHHCRTCGQIFDAKCMTTISGSSFGQSGNLRVCKPCEGLIHGYDDSSDYTDDDNASIMTARAKHRHGSKGAGDSSPVRPSTPSTRFVEAGMHGVRSNLNNFKSHFPSVIGRRMIDDLKRTSGQYEDDSDRKSIRPSTSRSLKSSHGMRPHTGHRRHHSKHLLQRNPRNMDDAKAPFYQGPDPTAAAGDRLPAFHSDNVIDPDLAAYLSDDGESEEEDHSIATALAGGPREDDSHTPLPGAMLKRPRSRYGDNLRILTGSQVDPDSISITSSKVATPIRHLRRRNVSFTGSAFQSSPPKPQRLSVAAQQWSSPSLDGLAGSLLHGRQDAGQMTRSISMRGARAPPVELNHASYQHGRRLLRQMLEENSVTSASAWEKALMPILLRATDDVAPNVQNGDAINITNYVKLKKVSGGKPGDTTYISGVVFSKNVALKSMKRQLSNPNIMIITFALEYSRHEPHFMSLEPVIRQEREYLQNLVNRIAALEPELLLVQRNVSGLAIEMLNKAKISTAYNVKRSVLEAISRCCQTRIITSLDKLATQSDTQSACESFYLKTFLQENRRKTYMYLSGCPRELGCTIVLRGASTSVLRKVKRVAEFMLQAIYNLRLETSLMRDEFAFIPHYGAEGTIRYETLSNTRPGNALADSVIGSRPNTATTTDSEGLMMAQVEGHAEGTPAGPSIHEEKPKKEPPRAKDPADQKQSELPDDIPAPTFYSDLVEKQRNRILSTSPFVKFMQPYLLQRARESERRLMHLKRLLDQDNYELSLPDKAKSGEFLLITPEMINETVQGTSRKIREILFAVHESEYEKATHVYRTQTKQWEASVVGNADMFNPMSHQSISVLHSLICTSTNIACTGPDMFTVRFYDDRGAEDGPEADCTLGQYVEDTCVSAGAHCQINGCEKRMFEHHRHYVHGEGRLEVTINRLPPKAPGLDEIALMWSACRICGKETQPVPISSNTWNYSFGKYLELAFWSIPLKPRAELCPHDLHHDYWRYFGYKNWAIRLQYDPVNILEVIVPRTRITWKVVNDLKFKNENFRKAEKRLNKFVTSVKARIKSIRVDTLLPEKVEECKEEIERLSRLIGEDEQTILHKLQEKYEGSKFYEIVPFNRAMRLLHEKAGEWDEIFADFADAFLPSEKDIKRLATIQVKKLLFGAEESGVSLASPEDTVNTSFTDDPIDGSSPNGTLASASESQVLSHEKAQEAAEAVDPNDPRVEHLDLATISSPTSPHTPQDPIPDGLTGQSHPIPEASLLLDGQTDPLTAPGIAPAEAALILTMNDERGGNGNGEKDKPQVSAIPRLAEHSRRNASSPHSQRSQSQPAHVRQLSATDAPPPTSPLQSKALPVGTEGQTDPASPEITPKPKRRLSQRLAGLRTGHSKIPRSVNSNRKETRVSALAKHFETLISREFQQERQRDQRKRAGRHRQAGAYPAAALKPVVEVYHSLQEAVGANEESVPQQAEDGENEIESEKTVPTAQGIASNQVTQTEGEGFHAIGTSAETGEPESSSGAKEQPTSTETGDEPHLDDAPESPTQASVDGSIAHSEPPDQTGTEQEIEDLDLDLPKHDKKNILGMLTNFWQDRSASGWEPLYYPLRNVDHLFSNSDIIVREDEPSSLIALALDHGDYQAQLKDFESVSAQTRALSEKDYVEDLFLTSDAQANIEGSLLNGQHRHLHYTFERGEAKMQCKIFWAEQMQAVRKKCGVSERIVESLSRCLKWDSKGGKTKSVFLKTLDDRFVLKSLSPIETKSFLKFATYYFKLMGEALFHELPSLIAKMLGFYQVTIKNPVTGTDFDWYLLLMENLFYDRSPDHIFDLKGSMRNRRIQSSGEQNEVLLDENMVDYIAENPIFAREHSKKLLRSSIYNDTLFLAKRNVMDYSMMLGIDEGKTELVVGIIDCIRTYTWDKQLETWVKNRGKNRPTVTEPKDYKNRFREAINRYVMQTPDCWHFGLAPNLGFKNARSETAMQEREEDGGDDAPDEI